VKLSEAENLFYKLRDKHNVCERSGYVWDFRFDDAKKRFGRCDHINKTISMSRVLVEINRRPVVEDTILHELAHALVGASEAHGPRWRLVAKSLGCTGKVSVTRKDANVPYQWLGTCPSCRLNFWRDRIGTRSLYCSFCCKRYNSGKVSKEYLVSWTEISLEGNNEH
jgi:predicted SprT family Zn-dependent metalloprotease